MNLGLHIIVGPGAPPGVEDPEKWSRADLAFVDSDADVHIFATGFARGSDLDDVEGEAITAAWQGARSAPIYRRTAEQLPKLFSYGGIPESELTR